MSNIIRSLQLPSLDDLRTCFASLKPCCYLGELPGLRAEDMAGTVPCSLCLWSCLVSLLREPVHLVYPPILSLSPCQNWAWVFFLPESTEECQRPSVLGWHQGTGVLGGANPVVVKSLVGGSSDGGRLPLTPYDLALMSLTQGEVAAFLSSCGCWSSLSAK